MLFLLTTMLNCLITGAALRRLQTDLTTNSEMQRPFLIGASERYITSAEALTGNTHSLDPKMKADTTAS